MIKVSLDPPPLPTCAKKDLQYNCSISGLYIVVHCQMPKKQFHQCPSLSIFPKNSSQTCYFIFCWIIFSLQLFLSNRKMLLLLKNIFLLWGLQIFAGNFPLKWLCPWAVLVPVFWRILFKFDHPCFIPYLFKSSPEDLKCVALLIGTSCSLVVPLQISLEQSLESRLYLNCVFCIIFLLQLSYCSQYSSLITNLPSKLSLWNIFFVNIWKC